MARFEAALGRPIGGQSEVSQLAQRPGETGGFLPEPLLGGLAFDPFGVQQRLQQRRQDDIVVGIDSGGALVHDPGGAGRQIELAKRRKAGIQPGAGRPGRCGGFHEL